MAGCPVKEGGNFFAYGPEEVRIKDQCIMPCYDTTAEAPNEIFDPDVLTPDISDLFDVVRKSGNMMVRGADSSLTVLQSIRTEEGETTLKVSSSMCLVEYQEALETIVKCLNYSKR